MQLAFLELTDTNNGATGWVNVEQIASVVDVPEVGTLVTGSFGTVTVAEPAADILTKITDLVNQVND
ncbi:hypothetical protein TRIXIE_38 [Mycobacterium phage Trixie]|uniref:Uncharacterized protein n=1 Tax=Mycobacterium phage Trixie TaxID=1071503 RepID=G1JV88_9CAUD|nr:hypothetical protein TRIXIE_38 [Mycobacterium phage Trixie]AEL17921.1 hypothetical protein TRIXIE_38 [Mycobacterium phage Trixie]